MEILIGLVILAVVGIPIAWAVIGVTAGAAVHAESKGREQATETADATLDALFATEAPTVTYDSRPFNSIPQTRVIDGAIQRGWELVNNERGLLLFKRA